MILDENGSQLRIARNVIHYANHFDDWFDQAQPELEGWDFDDWFDQAQPELEGWDFAAAADTNENESHYLDENGSQLRIAAAP